MFIHQVFCEKMVVGQACSLTFFLYGIYLWLKPLYRINR